MRRKRSEQVEIQARTPLDDAILLLNENIIVKLMDGEIVEGKLIDCDGHLNLAIDPRDGGKRLLVRGNNVVFLGSEQG